MRPEQPELAGPRERRPHGAIATSLERALRRTGVIVPILAGVAVSGAAIPALADGYIAPQVARCDATSPIRLANDLGCLALDGTAGGIDYPQAGTLGDIGLSPGWISASGSLKAGAGQFSAAVKFDNTPEIWAVPAAELPADFDGEAVPQDPVASWIVSPGAHEFAHAYVTGGTSTTFLKIGKVQRSVADTADDQPFSPLDLFDTRTALAPGVQTSVAPDLAGQALQLVSDTGGGHVLGLGLEGVARNATAIASWSYAAGMGTGHVTLIDPGILSQSFDALGFLVGATVNSAPFRLRTALAGDRTGWWNGLISTETTLGLVKLAASGEYLRNSTIGGDPAEFGGGVSASASLASGLAVHGNFDWVHDAASQSAPDSYAMGMQVSTALWASLKVTGSMGLSFGDGSGLVSPVPYGASTIVWSPDGGGRVSAGVARGEDGTYSFTTSATSSFD